MELYDEKVEQQILESRVPVLVEFYADWCGPCKAMEPIIKDIERLFENNLKVFIINIEKNQKLADKFTVLSLPTFLVYKNSKKVKALSGIQTKETIISLLN